jgi:hypothetical protein
VVAASACWLQHHDWWMEAVGSGREGREGVGCVLMALEYLPQLPGCSCYAPALPRLAVS